MAIVVNANPGVGIQINSVDLTENDTEQYAEYLRKFKLSLKGQLIRAAQEPSSPQSREVIVLLSLVAEYAKQNNIATNDVLSEVYDFLSEDSPR